jgi:predicted NAD/FAD-binding protein
MVKGKWHFLGSESMNSGKKRDVKIAIIGAGASGLSAAHQLKKLGYHEVTVFEKNEYAGGKVLSYSYGDRYYDLGAVILGKKDNYKNCHELLKEFNIPLERFMTPEIVYMDGNQIKFEDYLRERYSLLSSMHAMLKFFSLRWRFRKYFKHGFAYASPDLYLNFKEFIQKYKVVPFADTLQPFFVGCGYGYYEEVPALYLLRMLYWFVRSRLRVQGIMRMIKGDKEMDILTCKNGCQELCTKMTKQLHVEPNTRIQRIKRVEENCRIEIFVNDETRTFDRLIISSPLDETIHFMDVSEEEKDLFGKIEYSNYYVTLFKAKGFDKTVFIRDHVFPSMVGRTAAVCRQHPETNVLMGYQITPKQAKPGEVLANLKKDVAQLGGEIEEIIVQRQWRYFPRVKTENLKHSFYQRLDRLQG